MISLLRTLTFLWSLTQIGSLLVAETFTIVHAPDADRVIKTAASELRDHLRNNYPEDQFTVSTKYPEQGATILLGTREDQPVLAELVSAEQLPAEEAFVADVVDADAAYVCGATPRAVLYGVYQVLDRKYDYGFAMSFEASAAVRPGPFSLEHWQLSDHPIVPERFLFAWFNYLEVNGTWSFEDWEQALRNGARLGLNQLFFHCYANDPLLHFEFRGHEKPVGWRNNSRKGRTYAVEHVWDVRNLIGGSEVFDGPVFGSEAAVVPDEERVEAARDLMRRVIQRAKDFGYHVIWGIDIDTKPTWDRQFIAKAVPEAARFSAGGRWNRYEVVDPTAAAGRDFFRSMLQTYLDEMPGVDTYMLWVRRSQQTPVLGMTFDALPAAWQQDLRRQLPEGSPMDSKQSPGIYYVNQVAECWRSILDEAGHADKGIGFGSWSWQLSEKFLPANVLMAPEVSFLIVDYMNAFGRSKTFNEVVRTIAEKRVVGPLLRNKNDDGGYFGKPASPQQNLAETLAQTGAQRIGTYSYMPRPSDLYTITVARQLWESTQNEGLDEVIADAAQDWFGEEAAPLMREYLTEWMDSSPIIGRTSGDHFQEDISQKWLDRHLQSTPERIAMLERVDLNAMPPPARNRWSYFRNLEEFMLKYHQAQRGFQNNETAVLQSQLPEEAIARYVDAVTSHDLNPGEKGLLIGLHTRWLSWIVAKRQAYGFEATRINFQPTNHDPHARKPGKRTFFSDDSQKLWAGLGQKETGYRVEMDRPDGETALEVVCGIYLESEKPITLELGNVRNEPELGSGLYRVTLYLPGHLSGREMTVQMEGQDMGNITVGSSGPVQAEQFDPILIDDGVLNLTLTPTKGKAVIGGIFMEPVGPIQPFVNSNEKEKKDEEL